MYRCCLILAVAILGGAVAAAAVGAQEASRLSPVGDGWDAVRGHVAEEMARLEVPGAAVAVVRDDRVVFAEGFGVADADGRAVESDTPFAIASVSKWITALAIMQLVDDGLVELDAPISRYLPSFAATTTGTGSTTVLQLLTHTSGWTTRDGLENWASTHDDATALAWNAERLSATPRQLDPGFFSYSNANYDVLGELVEAVTGRSYEAYVAGAIFRPLGMRSSFTSWDAAHAAGLATGHYRFFGDPVPLEVPFVRSSLPSAFLTSSADDLARLAIAALNGGRHGDVELLTADSMALMQRPLATRGARSAEAMGMRLEPLDHETPGGATDRVRTILRRGGDLVTYASEVVLLPVDRIGVVVLMNTNDPLAPRPYHQLAVEIATMVLGGPGEPAGTAATAGTPVTAALGKPLLLFALVVQVAIATHPRHGWRTVERIHDAIPSAIAVATLVGTAAVLVSTPSVPPLAAMRLAPDVALAVLAIGALGVPALQPRGLRRRTPVIDDGTTARSPGTVTRG